MYILIIAVFLLSIIVFTEFYLDAQGLYVNLRIILMAIRYSATPFIIAMTLYTLAKKERWFVFIPAMFTAVINIASIYTGIVFSLTDAGALKRGPLGYLPFVAVGFYCFFLVFTLFFQSNKQATEIIPIVFLALSFISGLILPFILKRITLRYSALLLLLPCLYTVFSRYSNSQKQIRSRDFSTVRLMKRQSVIIQKT